MKLYMTESSGNAYKVRLLLGLLQVPYEKALVDFPGKAHKQPAFLKLNPRGQVPVLEDGGRVFWDSTACLVYVAREHGGEKWLPVEAGDMAEVMQWMALAANEIQFGLQYARGIVRGMRQGNLEECQATGRIALEALEQRLKGHEWLALDHPTIADLACYPYVALAHESKLPLDSYPGIRGWMQRLEALPGWTRRS
ncbi:MAG TPA: glutathione S-transferase family protein [Burkholderiales bacterium]